MPTIDYSLDMTITVEHLSIGRQVELLIGYDECNPGEWSIEESTLNGIGVDKLGLLDLVEEALDGHIDKITALCIEAEAMRREFDYECRRAL